MIVCKLCGNANPDAATFCGDCGRFLEWAGQTVVVPETITVIEQPPPEVPDTPPKGWWRRQCWRLRRALRNRFRSYKIKTKDEAAGGERVVQAASLVTGAGPTAPADAPLAAATTLASVPPLPADGLVAAASSPPPGPPSAPPPPGPPSALPPPGPPGAAKPSASPGAPSPASRAPGPPPPSAPPVPPKPPAPPGAAKPPAPPGAATPPAPPGSAKPPAPPGPPAAGTPPAPPGAARPPGPPAPPSPPGSPAPQVSGQPAVPQEPDESAAAEAAAKAELAAALVNPVEGTAVMPDYDTPELPPQPVVRKVRPIVKTKPSRRLEPGDLVCAACGEGNAPTRKFCSRCGESLADAGVVTAVWWRRFFRWVARLLRGPTHPAGTRPGQKGTREHRQGVVRRAFRKVRLVLVALLMILAMVFVFDASFRSVVYQDADSLFHKVEPGYSPIQPVKITANAQLPGHPAAAADDEYTDTYWLANWSPAKLPTITFKFSTTVILHKVILLGGAEGYFVQNGRPSILKLTYSDGSTQLITLQDTASQQILTLSNSAFVSSVSVQVVDIYPGEGNRQNVAITEMQWFEFR